MPTAAMEAWALEFDRTHAPPNAWDAWWTSTSCDDRGICSIVLTGELRRAHRVSRVWNPRVLTGVPCRRTAQPQLRSDSRSAVARSTRGAPPWRGPMLCKSVVALKNISRSSLHSMHQMLFTARATRHARDTLSGPHGAKGPAQTVEIVSPHPRSTYTRQRGDLLRRSRIL